MKTAMQELIEDLTNEINNRNSVQATNKMYHTSTRIVQEILDFYVKPLLEKEKEQINILINALERIRDWDDEMHSEWDDCGDFARFTLQTYKLEI